jgi:hypothetical protein
MNQNRLIHIIYPLFLYFAAEQVISLLLQLLPIGGGLDAVARQGLGTLGAFLVLYLFCRSGDRRERYLPIFLKPVTGQLSLGFAGAVLMLGCAGVAMNNLLSLVNLASYSASYRNVEQAFYSSGVLLELLVLGIIAPIAEEFLYRGVIYRELRGLGRMPAIVLSSLIFGAVHLNLVQFVYAAVLGLLLGILTEYYQDVRPAMLGHMAANIISLLRAETDFLSWLTPGQVSFLPMTIALSVLAVVFAVGYVKKLMK